MCLHNLQMKTLWLALVCLLICTKGSGRRRIPSWHIKMVQKQGPNTCAVEEVPGTNKRYWTECKYWTHREICGHKTVVRYECCEGFFQVSNKPGCSGVKPLSSVLDTALDLGATIFVDYLRQSGLADRIQNSRTAVTLFVPTNEAFENMNMKEWRDFEESLRQAEPSHLLYHIAESKINSRDFLANTEIESMNSGEKLRVNRYSSGMITVNCVPIIRKDQESKNGIVHLIDRVLTPRGNSRDFSIPEVILRDSRFRELTRMLLQSPVVNDLRRSGPFTFLAPYDEAFQKIQPSQIRQISEDSWARTAFLKDHIIPHTLCPSAIMDTHKMKTLGGHQLELTCNQSGIYVNGARMTAEVLLADNGIINVITEVLIPDEVRSMMDLIDKHSEQLSTFASLVRLVNLEGVLQQSHENLTIFVPSNTAFEALAPFQLEVLKNNREHLRRLLQYHMAHGLFKTNTIVDDMRLETFDRRQELRLKVYRKATGVESAIIEGPDIVGQNGVLHIIDRVLLPSNRSIMDFLQTNDEYSTFVDAIRRVRQLEPDFLASHNTSFTVFAPNNDAFEEMDSDQYDSLMNNRRKLKQLIQNHIVDDLIPSGSFQSRLLYDVLTEAQRVKVHKRKGNLMVNNAHVIESDVMATDGIVHCIDQVLLPENRYTYRHRLTTIK